MPARLLAMIFWVLYRRSAIAHATGSNKRGVAMLRVLHDVIAERVRSDEFPLTHDFPAHMLGYAGLDPDYDFLTVGSIAVRPSLPPRI